MIQNKLFFFLFVSLPLAGSAQSRFFTDSLFSSSLNEYRRITIYLPDKYDEHSIVYPVIYTTDGQLITDFYRKSMDSLIENKLTAPFILIGSHSNEQPVGGVEYRNLDYMRMKYNPESPLTIRFNEHMKFYSEELIQYAESNYRVSIKPQERIFYGVSNGADFGVSLAQDHPELVKCFILFSVFGGTEKPFKWKEKDGIYFYLGYGIREMQHVEEEALRMEEYFIKRGISHFLVTWTGGHDRKEWELAFFKALVRLEEQLK
ncbi:alpha/beta hydrolase-fold protein [Fluviicola taffensis]|uniref:alpha/beta hydrolase n=1 Tax=Fluviicola taffensis TaxID=191579 RepID=UPI00313841EE